jgi:HD-like signal output (HDOD) protein
MAVPLLAKELPQQYEELLESRKSGHARLSELERERFGWTHAEAAGVMARGWSLPEEFAVLIETHADLVVLLENGSEPSKLAVALSALLPSASDAEWGERQWFEETYTKLRGPEWPEITGVLGQVDTDFEEFAPVLKLAVPGRSLVESYNEPADANA